MKYCCCRYLLVYGLGLNPRHQHQYHWRNQEWTSFLKIWPMGWLLLLDTETSTWEGGAWNLETCPAEMDSWTEAAMCYTLRQRLHSEIHFPIKHPGSFPLEVRYFELTRSQSWPIYFLLFVLPVSLSWLLLYMNMGTVFTHSLYQTEIKWLSVTRSSLYNITLRSSQVTSERANKNEVFYLKVYSMGFSSGYSVIVPCWELPVPLHLSHWKLLQEMSVSVHSFSANIWVGFWLLLVWGESIWT